MKKLKALIIINAYHQDESYLYQPKRLKEELEKLDVDVNIVKNDEILIMINEGEVKARFKEVDFIIYLDKDRYNLKALEKLNIRTFNSSDAIATSDDKMLTYLALANNNIKMPKTLSGPLCYFKNTAPRLEMIKNVEKELSYPFILKENYGSLGKNVYLIKSRDELIKRISKLTSKAYLMQEYIKTSYGKDIRVIVIGNKFVGAMLREAKNDFRSNVSQGGSAKSIDISDTLKEEAIKISKILKLDYAGLDFLFTEDGFTLSEVNSNAFFKAFESATKINVAKKYAEYIVDQFK